MLNHLPYPIDDNRDPDIKFEASAEHESRLFGQEECIRVRIHGPWDTPRPHIIVFAPNLLQRLLGITWEDKLEAAKEKLTKVYKESQDRQHDIKRIINKINL